MIVDFGGNGGGGGEYVLPKASATVLGGVKVGNNLSIDGNGVLSATGGGEGGAKQYYYCDMERHLDEAGLLIDEMLDRLKSGDSNFIVGAFRDWYDYPAGAKPTLENYEDPDGWGYEAVKFRSIRYDSDGYVFKVSNIILKRNYDTEGNIDYTSSENTVYQYDGGGEGGGNKVYYLTEMTDEERASLYAELWAMPHSDSDPRPKLDSYHFYIQYERDEFLEWVPMVISRFDGGGWLMFTGAVMSRSSNEMFKYVYYFNSNGGEHIDATVYDLTSIIK